jgi:predicted hydrocarbon binding protein
MPPEKSTFAYPNKFARIYLEALEEILGRGGLTTLLSLADLDLFGHFPPPDNMEKGFDFAYMTALQVGLRNMGGPQMGAGLANRSGRATFKYGYHTFGEQLELDELRALPLPEKLEIGLPMMAEFFTRFSDQVSNAYAYDEERLVYTLERCPMCWNHEADMPFCHAGQGLIQEALRWISDGQEFEVEMVQCIAVSDEMGKYVIYKTPRLTE